jgi:hypothetical protein
MAFVPEGRCDLKHCNLPPFEARPPAIPANADTQLIRFCWHGSSCCAERDFQKAVGSDFQ